MKARLMLLSVLLLASPDATAQKPSETMPSGKNPHMGNPASIKSGLALYRVRCGDCHGLDAKGYRGPDLTAVLAGMADERLFATIRKGVSGTEMPPSTLPDDEVLMLMAYLHNIGGAATPEKLTGNVENGAKLFGAQCATCHRVGERGGRLGPDLSRVGVARSRTALIREIRTPSDWMPPGFEPVTLVTKDGQRIRAVKKAEDLFSIQVMDARERIQGYRRSDLKDVIYEKASLMPEYGRDRLSDAELEDLVSYLSSLRAASLLAR